MEPRLPYTLGFLALVVIVAIALAVLKPPSGDEAIVLHETPLYRTPGDLSRAQISPNDRGIDILEILSEGETVWHFGVGFTKTEPYHKVRTNDGVEGVTLGGTIEDISL